MRTIVYSLFENVSMQSNNNIRILAVHLIQTVGNRIQPVELTKLNFSVFTLTGKYKFKINNEVSIENSIHGCRSSISVAYLKYVPVQWVIGFVKRNFNFWFHLTMQVEKQS